MAFYRKFRGQKTEPSPSLSLSSNPSPLTTLTLLAALTLQSCSATYYGGYLNAPARKIASTPAQESEQPWTLSAYLASQPGLRVYITIHRGRIIEVSPNRPGPAPTAVLTTTFEPVPGATNTTLSAPSQPQTYTNATGPAGNPGVNPKRIVDTNATVFPGFIDMHNHARYNVLPLWDLARGQFTNRFEWRTKFGAYRDAVSNNMKPIRGDTGCAAVRWGELKALTGGATTMQGIGNDTRCAKGFGPGNVEIAADVGGHEIRAINEVVIPDLIGNVYQKYLEPEMAKGATYDEAYAKMLEQHRVNAWVKHFTTQTHSVPNALKLLIGTDFKLDPSLMHKKDFENAELSIKKRLAGPPFNASPEETKRQLGYMKKWIFGDEAGNGGYLKAKKEERVAFDFLTRAGVLAVPAPIRRYIRLFETDVRRSALNYFNEAGHKALFAHVGEGLRNDRYNRLEYGFAKKFGLNQSGLVLIHGVGLDAADFADAAANNVSIVWSPFSNLLLYGETLDVAAARRAKVNLTLGSDWSPTGSKTLLDELKIARRYLDRAQVKGVSNKDLIDMVTVNAAKALGMEEEMGRVKEGHLANLTLINCRAGRDPYECAVNANQADVSLVVVNGQGLYGEVPLIKQIAKMQDDDKSPELLPRSTPRNKDCTFRKAVRFLGQNEYDVLLAKKNLDFRSVENLEHHLDAALARSESREQKATLDPLFACGDEKYSRRFGEFIAKELDFNARNRASGREEGRLTEEWSPFALPVAEEDIQGILPFSDADY